MLKLTFMYAHAHLNSCRCSQRHTLMQFCAADGSAGGQLQWPFAYAAVLRGMNAEKSDEICETIPHCNLVTQTDLELLPD